MADLSHWFAQAYEYHDSAGTFKVIYFQDRQELIAVGEELLRKGDSWSDDLFSSNLKCIAHKDEDTIASPDIRSWQPHSPVPASVAENGLGCFISKKLFDDLPGCPTSSGVPKESTAWDPNLLVCKDGNKVPSSQIMSTISSKHDVRVKAQEKEKLIEYKKSEQPGLLNHITNLWTWMRGRGVRSSQAYKTKDQQEDEGSNYLPQELIPFLDNYYDPYKDSRPPGYCKYALLFGIPTEFNPSGVWVIEELYNDMQESDF